MTDKHIFYELNGERYKIPTEKKGDFERMAPTAKVMMTFKGENYGVPLTEVNSFVNSAGAKNVTYSEFDEKKKYSPDDSTLGYFEAVESPSADLEETEVAVAAEMPEVQTEVQEKPDSTFLQRFGESMMMSKGMPMNEAQPQKSEPVKADADIEDAIFSSHAEHKKSADDYIARVDAEYNASKSDEPAKGFLQRLGESLTRAQDEMSQGASSFKMEERREAIEKGRDYRDAKIAQNISDKVDDKIKQYQDPAKTFAGGVAQGFGDAVLDLDTWDSTIGANQAARVYEISKKLDKGESLTEGEQMIVDALVDDLASDMYLASGFGRGYKAGRVTGESLPFMLETMANPASGLGESITKKFGKEIFKQVSKKLGKTMAKAAVYGTRVAGDIAGASIMSATTSQPRVVADALDRLTGEVDFKINEDGTLGFDGFVGGEDSALKAYAKAFGSNAIEHYSEMIGNYFSPIGKMTKKGVANLADKIGAKKIKSLLTEMTPNGFGALLGDFAEQTQWHGTIGEFAEEMISGALNALVVGDQTLKKYDENGNLNQNYLFEKENMIDTFLGVAILGGVMSTAKTLGYTTPEARFNKAISDAKAGLEGVVSEEEMRQLEAFASNPMGADYANLDPFFDKSREEGYKRAVGRYVAAIMEKQGYNIAKSADLSGTKQGMNELMNAYRVGQNMSEADLYDVTDAEAKAQQALVDSGFLNAAGEDGADIMQQTLGYSSYDLFTLADKLERDNGIVLDDKQRTALKNLAVIKNAREGLENKLNGYTRMAIAANDAVSNGAAKDGILTVGFHNGKKVYVKGGVKVSNGSISKPSDITSYPVEIVDSMTGEATTVESGELSNVENIDLAVYNKNMADAITNAYNLRWEGWRNTKSAKSKLAEVEKFVGQKVFINTPDGKMAEVEVQQILPNGEVLIKGKKGDLGQQNIRVDADSFYDSMSRDADGNPIFNQSEFRSQSANIKAAQDKMYALGQQGSNVSAPTNTTPAVPVTEEAPATAPEAEVEVTEEDDFRGLVTPIIINGVPVEVEVVSQDGPSDTIVYEYEDENGNIKRGKTTIGGFKTALDQAKNYQPETPAAETPVAEEPEVPATEEAPEVEEPTAEETDWDALFAQDPEAYFAELQNQFGDKTATMLNAVITATQSELEALGKAKPKTQNEIFANEAKKEELQAKIDILNGMVTRLTAAEAPAAPEVPETPAAPEVVPEDSTPESETPEPQPIAPNPVDNPIREAQKKEKALATQIMRYDLTHELKQDLAFKAGKAVADFFATREEYDAYAENATDLGDYYEDFERGVDESFANRPQNTGNSQGNSVPLGNKPKGENNGESGEADGTSGNGPSAPDNSGGSTNEGAEGGDQTAPKVGKGKTNKGKAGKKVEDKYPARKGNATQKLLVDTFGFNKVEIPNSRKETLNTIYDFMMAMSKMLGISPKSIGQGGWLDVGSLRSNAQSSAEHSLISKVIDQSVVKATLKYKYAKLKGLAHEWWHALDHALSYFETGKGKITASEIPASRFTGRQETWYAVNQVIKAIKDSGHESRMFTLGFPRRYVDYLVEPTEMAARAFEEYMKAKFAAAGIVIDNAVDTDYIAQPTAEEMAVITPAFDNLFNVLQEKEGKTPGTSVLFHIGEEMEEGSEAWRLATEAVLQALDNSRIDVTRVTDEQVARMLAIKEELYGIDWMTVYHGSGNKFDKFDHSHMGEGEGAQAHGWGTYVAVDSATSEAYAKQMGGGNQVLMNGNDVTDVARSLVYDPQSHVAYLISMLKSYGDGNKVREHILGSIEEEKAYIDFFKDSAEHKSGYEHSVAELEKLEKALELYDSNTWSIEERKSQLYTVEIPEDNGSNYLYETGYTDSQIEKIADACEKEGIDFLEVAAMASELSDKRDGARLYKSLAKVLGSDKDASEFLSRAGFAGIKYNGRVDGECFVIFNENDAKITGHTEFFQTTNGTVYGWTDGKKIYLTEAGLNPNTPIHEYTHLWARAMMQKNPKGWNSIKKLLKGTPAWNDVINDPNYRNISNDEDAVASEALSRISGSENAAKMEYMAQKMIDDAKGTGRRLEAVGLIQNMRDALNRFWEFVWKDLFGMTNFRSVEHVTDRILFDLLNNTDLGELSEGQVETQIVTDPKVIAELEASPKKTGYRNVVQNEDGTFSSPMAYWLQNPDAGAKSRIATAKFEMGKWEEAEEHPEVVSEKGYVTLVKPNKKTVGPVAYDPYIHNRLDPVNLQFKEAWKRNDLVYVETEVAETDLESGYHADKAKLPVGVHSWSNGAVMLSKYDKPVRVLPWEDVADAWAARLNGEGVEFDVVPPALLPLLVERGVEILPPHKNSGKDCEDAYAEFKNAQETKTTSGERGGAVSGNPSSEGLPLDDRGHLSHDSLAHPIDLANVEKNTIATKTAIKKLFNRGSFKEKITDALSAVREVSKALKLVKSDSSLSYYSDLYEGDFEINGKIAHVRISGHPANGERMGNAQVDTKISLVIYDNGEHVSTGIHEGYVEYTYYPSDIDPEDAAWSIANGIKSLLEGDGFVDNSGKAKEQTYPYNNGKGNFVHRKADAQNAAVDFLAGEPRLSVIENAVNEEAAKLGVSVTYKTRSEMPDGHENDKGYYNTKTGEIVICTENASSIADAIQTILHESVAHKGLRALMGDKFNEFINRVYESLDAETKAKVDALAAEHYDGNTAVATEEYIASLAETEDFANNSLWEKIKSIFEDIINAILDRNDIKIGDNELRYILRASYNNMVNPRGMESMRVWAQDQMMREEYKINQASPEILSRTGIDPDEIARGTARQVYDYNVNTNWNEFQRQFQDAMQPVRVAIDAIQQATGNVPIEDYENYILVQNQASSRSRVEIDEFSRRYYTPIIEQVNAVIDAIMKARGWRLRDKNKRAQVYAEVRQYLIAKHGLERNAYYQSHNMRKLNYWEKKKETEAAQKEYDDKVDAINADTTLTDAERDLQLRQAQDEFDAAITEINTREVPDLRDYSGLTSLFGMEPKKFREAEAEAEALVNDFEAEVGGVTAEMWKKINAATDKTLRHSYESGMISRQQYNDIKSMFKFYIPLRGFDETTAEDVYSYARFEGNRFNPAVQTAKGRTSVADDPIAIIMNMAESEIAQGNKNRAKQALYNYLLNRAEGHQGQNSLMQIESVWYVKTVDGNGNEVFVIAAPDHEGGETYEDFENRMLALAAEDKATKSKKGHVDVGMRFQKQQNRNAHYVYLKVNGVDKAIYINGDPKAADAINGVHGKPKGALTEKMGALNRFISSTFTNYSLEFTARNYFRDMFYSHINIDAKEKDPAYRKKFRQNWRHNNLGTMMRMLKAYRAGEFEGRPLNEDEAAFVEFMANGGQTGYTVINSVENHKAELERAIKNMQNGIEKGGIKDSTVFKFTLGSIELLNEASELVTRFAAFKTSRDMGRGVVRAISDAKEITVNFNTKGAQDANGFFGSIARYFGWSKFFFNASVQGVQNIKAMAEANKLKFCSTVGGVAAIGFLMPVFTSVIAEILGGDDDEYWNIPEYERQNNFCIPLGNGKYAKIPLPIGFREVYAIGDMVAAMAWDKKFTRDVGQVGTDIANKIASVVLPINPLESAANGLSLWHTLLYTALPSSFQFAIQNATNIDWKGAPLQKEYTYNEDDPQWMKAFKSNPAWMVGLSKWCNEHIGTGDYKGWDWSPEKLDNTLSNVFGGIYSLIKKTGRTISMAWDEEERNLSNVPLAGVIVGSGIDSDERRVDDAYFTEKDYYDERIGSIKRVAKRFGYDLKDIFVEGEGRHNPKMIKDIYSKKDFDFMQEWYLGHEGNLDGDTEAEVKGLDRMRQDIKNLEKQINKYEDEIPQDLIDELIEKTNEFEAYRRELVEDLIELD
jgi:hypothetical protein